MPAPSNEPASLPTMPTTHMMGHSEKCQLFIIVVNLINILIRHNFHKDSHHDYDFDSQ